MKIFESSWCRFAGVWHDVCAKRPPAARRMVAVPDISLSGLVGALLALRKGHTPRTTTSSPHWNKFYPNTRSSTFAVVCPYAPAVLYVEVDAQTLRRLLQWSTMTADGRNDHRSSLTNTMPISHCGFSGSTGNL